MWKAGALLNSPLGPRHNDLHVYLLSEWMQEWMSKWRTSKYHKEFKNQEYLFLCLTENDFARQIHNMHSLQGAKPLTKSTVDSSETVLYLLTDMLFVNFSYLFTKAISPRNSMNLKVIKLLLNLLRFYNSNH